MRSTLIIFMLLLVPAVGNAQQFRIDTQIYQGDQKEPVSENVTLFSEGVVFDVQNAGSQTHEVTILEPRLRRIVLLDHVRQVKMQLDELQLLKMADSLRKQTATNKTAGFLVNDRFEESVNFDTGQATVSSPQIVYSVTGRRPADIRILPLYNQFIDYFTRMKFSDPRALPPFPRLRLNETISKLSWIPSEVNVTINKNGLFKDGLKATSKHTLIPHLSDSDQATISQIKKQWLNYKAVSLDDYRRLGRGAAKTNGPDKESSEDR